MTNERLEQIIRDTTIPCTDNGVVFTNTARLDFIQNTLSTSNYSCFAEPPLARLYKHKNFRDSCPFIVISCHIDSIYESYYCERSGHELRGTFDNSACNAIALHAMLEDQLGVQAVICFTGDEEDESRGADQVVEALMKLGLIQNLKMVITMDLTEESFGRSFTAENVFEKKHPGDEALFEFLTRRDLRNYVEALIPGIRVIKNGDPDESWQYDEHDLNCFSFCLPCRLLGEDMHDSIGVALTFESILEYATALNELVVAIEKDLAN